MAVAYCRMCWIQLAQGLVQWQTSVNMTFSFSFHKKAKVLLDKLSDCQYTKRTLQPLSFQNLCAALNIAG